MSDRHSHHDSRIERFARYFSTEFTIPRKRLGTPNKKMAQSKLLSVHDIEATDIDGVTRSLGAHGATGKLTLITNVASE